MDLDIPDGQHVAIVGPSGIGKSTLAGVLAGMLRPTAGQIRLAGRLLSEVPAAELPGYRVLIPQQAYVFAGTLGENLTYLAPAARPADVAASAEAVGLEPLVARLGDTAPTSARRRCQRGSASSSHWPGPTYRRPGWPSWTRPPATCMRPRRSGPTGRSPTGPARSSSSPTG
jgi:ABC-type multidrug transport system fused ATPase/permease subunit